MYIPYKRDFSKEENTVPLRTNLRTLSPFLPLYGKGD